MSLGGIDYTACPFNGWFMNTEVQLQAVQSFAENVRLNRYFRRIYVA